MVLDFKGLPADYLAQTSLHGNLKCSQFCGFPTTILGHEYLWTTVWSNSIPFSRLQWCQWKWMYWEWREQMQLESLPLRPDSYLATVPLRPASYLVLVPLRLESYCILQPLRPESYLARSCQKLSLSLSLCHCTSLRWLVLKFEFPKTKLWTQKRFDFGVNKSWFPS